MRINKFVAQASGISRRAADKALQEGRVKINGQTAQIGSVLQPESEVTLDGQLLKLPSLLTIMLNKPVGYVVSRNGQGSQTIYELLPPELHQLKPVGRLDKDSSGLLLLTNDGDLANGLTHPSFTKQKVYLIKLNKNLDPKDKSTIVSGVELEDGVSKLELNGEGANWQVTMHEGRNRQIRRTFEKLGYKIVKLHRTNFGDYAINDLPLGEYRILSD